MPPLYSASPDRTYEHAAPTVVFIDDGRAVVEVVCAALEEHGIVAIACPHGHYAHSCVRATQPKAVILDIQMPEVDGVLVFRLMRADPATLAIPVIFLTANARMLVQRVPDYDKMNAHLLPKPFDVDELVELVTRVLPV